MSNTEPIEYTINANYVANAPDLQIRLCIRSLVASEGIGYGLSDIEKIEILRSEADRIERNLKQSKGASHVKS